MAKAIGGKAARRICQEVALSCWGPLACRKILGRKIGARRNESSLTFFPREPEKSTPDRGALAPWISRKGTRLHVSGADTMTIQKG